MKQVSHSEYFGCSCIIHAVIGWCALIMYCSWKYRYPSHRGIFGLIPFQLHQSFLAQKLWTSPPLCNFWWPSFGWVWIFFCNHTFNQYFTPYVTLWIKEIENILAVIHIYNHLIATMTVRNCVSLINKLYSRRCAHFPDVSIEC